MYIVHRCCRDPGLGTGGPRAAEQGAACATAANGRAFSVCLACLHNFGNMSSIFLSKLSILQGFQFVSAIRLSSDSVTALHYLLLLRRAQQLLFESVTDVSFFGLILFQNFAEDGKP